MCFWFLLVFVMFSYVFQPGDPDNPTGAETLHSFLELASCVVINATRGCLFKRLISTLVLDFKTPHFYVSLL